MTFLNILGLLGLLSILALIVIYIIKPKYQERQIGSSFIWKLSLQYKKRKIPLEWFKNSVLIMIQILILLILTLILMKPHLTTQTNSGEKIIILDISASMLAEDNGVTLLNKAIEEIDDLAKETIENNDKFTLITTGQTNELLAHRSSSYEFINTKLRTINSSFSTANVEDAITLTEDVLNINPNAEIMFFTSYDYETTNNITIKNMSNNEHNVAILSFEGEYDISLNYTFTVEVASYNKDINNAVLELEIDGETITSTTVTLPNNETVVHSWKIPGLNKDSYNEAKVSFLDIEDDFTYDNSLTFINKDNPFYVQIVTPEDLTEINTTNEYITRALRSLDRNYSITTTNDLENASQIDYDLYIYIEQVPDTLPQDGAIWIFNPDSLPQVLNANIGNDVEVDNISLSLSTPSKLSEELLQLVRPNEITVSKYKTITNTEDYTVLLEANNDPVLLTKDIEGVKVSIFTFGLDYSNLPILFLDFPVLVQNLSNYSVIPTIEENIYDAGQTVEINANPMTESITLTTNDSITTYTDFPIELELSSIGTYQITQTYNDGRMKIENFFVRVPKTESEFDIVGDELLSPVVLNTNQPVLQNDNLTSLIIYFSIALLVLIIIEWEVQHREQY